MPNETRASAADVANLMLDVTGHALMTDDFAAFRRVFHVPQTMSTLAGPVQMETVDDMQRAFTDMCKHFKAIGVTDMIRTVVAAEYQSENQVASTHVSELLHDGKRLADPYPVFSVIEKIDGDWKIIRSEYAWEASSGQTHALNRGDKSRRPAATE